MKIFADRQTRQQYLDTQVADRGTSSATVRSRCATRQPQKVLGSDPQNSDRGFHLIVNELANLTGSPPPRVLAPKEPGRPAIFVDTRRGPTAPIDGAVA